MLTFYAATIDNRWVLQLLLSTLFRGLANLFQTANAATGTSSHLFLSHVISSSCEMDDPSVS